MEGEREKSPGFIFLSLLGVTNADRREYGLVAEMEWTLWAIQERKSMGEIVRKKYTVNITGQCLNNRWRM